MDYEQILNDVLYPNLLKKYEEFKKTNKTIYDTKYIDFKNVFGVENEEEFEKIYNTNFKLNMSMVLNKVKDIYFNGDIMLAYYDMCKNDDYNIRKKLIEIYINSLMAHELGHFFIDENVNRGPDIELHIDDKIDSETKVDIFSYQYLENKSDIMFKTILASDFNYNKIKLLTEDEAALFLEFIRNKITSEDELKEYLEYHNKSVYLSFPHYLKYFQKLGSFLSSCERGKKIQSIILDVLKNRN